jgi:ribosomal protein S18 acetylase RimI-like enzyme
MITIHEIAIEEAEELADFIEKAWLEAGSDAMGWTGSNEANIVEIASQRFLSGLLATRNVRIFTALENREIVGFTVTRGINLHEVEIAGIIVLESKTSLGIGGRLLNTAITSVVNEGYDKVIVKTESKNHRARKFYVENGFQFVKTVQENIEGKEIDLAVYQKNVK